MYHVSIFLEHVDLFNGLNRLSVQFLQCRLQLLVIADCRFMDLLRLSSWCALSTISSWISLVQRLRRSGVWLEVILGFEEENVPCIYC